jgi:peptidoglycan/LPS O-acetylase OafA/YrhL
VIAGVTTCYLVTTALTAVRRPVGWSRRLDVVLMLLALGVGLTSVALGFDTMASPTGRREDGLPPFPFFMFGVVGLVAGVGDIRMIRSGGLQGAPRLARHLWRMCWALWVAAASFFLGQADEFPVALRRPALLAVPVLVPLAALLYWMWRVRIRRALRGLVLVGAPDAALEARPAHSR